MKKICAYKRTNFLHHFKFKELTNIYFTKIKFGMYYVSILEDKAGILKQMG